MTVIRASSAIPAPSGDHAKLLERGVDADASVLRMGEYVPPMLTLRDPDGNRFRMVQRD
jgi:hypothetical protein